MLCVVLAFSATSSWCGVRPGLTPLRSSYVGLSSPSSAPPSREQRAMADSSALLDALDHWLRKQSIATVLPKAQARQLLLDLRDDQRFWAQQRRQFARAWVLFEAGLRAETRPVGTLLGKETSAKILSIAEEMATDPALVNAVVRSEIVEVRLFATHTALLHARPDWSQLPHASFAELYLWLSLSAKAMLGYVLYNGIGQFMQQADLIGLALNNVPILGPLRVQLLELARSNMDTLIGPQVCQMPSHGTDTAGDAVLEPCASYWCNTLADELLLHGCEIAGGTLSRRLLRVCGGICRVLRPF
eukprot:scaffold14292_cov33-Tisochrysis_lutea.AAC.2